jgi:hypothetical protein
MNIALDTMVIIVYNAFVKMDTHSRASPDLNPLTPLLRIRLSFAFFRFSARILIDTSTIRNALNPPICNTDSRSNRQKVKICSTPFAKIRRTNMKVSRIPTRNTSRLAFSLTHSKHSHLIFLPETPPRCSGRRSPTSQAPTSRHESRPGSPTSPLLACWGGQVTDHESRHFLIVNMIIRIVSKSFALNATFISNRQYSGGSAK